MRVFSVDYGHLIKHRNTARISGKAERIVEGGGEAELHVIGGRELPAAVLV